METIKDQVYMLPTDKAPIGTILLATGTTSYCVKDGLCINENPEFDKEVRGFGGSFYQPQHLYFTTDEEIKEEDWLISTNAKGESSLHQCIGSSEKYYDVKGNFGLFKEICRKIVATTNPDLWHTLKERPFKQIGTNGVAKIPSQFIKEYIKHPVTEVLLEIENHFVSGSYYNKCAICGKQFKDTDKRWYLCPKHSLSLKLSSDGCVVIHSPQQNMYTWDEMVEAATRWDAYRGEILDTPIIRREWFMANYAKY